jgi:hypothetical protein
VTLDEVEASIAVAMKARGILPDVVKDDVVALFKACRELRLTYEIRLATFMAVSTGRRLLLIVTDECHMSRALEGFVREHRVEIMRRKA